MVLHGSHTGEQVDGPHPVPGVRRLVHVRSTVFPHQRYSDMECEGHLWSAPLPLSYARACSRTHSHTPDAPLTHTHRHTHAHTHTHPHTHIHSSLLSPYARHVHMRARTHARTAQSTIRSQVPNLLDGEFGAMNAIASAQSLGRLAACLANGGEYKGVRIISEAGLKTMLSHPKDAMLKGDCTATASVPCSTLSRASDALREQCRIASRGM